MVLSPEYRHLGLGLCSLAVSEAMQALISAANPRPLIAWALLASLVLALGFLFLFVATIFS